MQSFYTVRVSHCGYVKFIPFLIIFVTILSFQYSPGGHTENKITSADDVLTCDQ